MLLEWEIWCHNKPEVAPLVDKYGWIALDNDHLGIACYKSPLTLILGIGN